MKIGASITAGNKTCARRLPSVCFIMPDIFVIFLLGQQLAHKHKEPAHDILMKRGNKSGKYDHDAAQHQDIFNRRLAAPVLPYAAKSRFYFPHITYSSSSNFVPSEEMSPFSMALTTASVRLLTPSL